MEYNLGDKVRITNSGIIGNICDISISNGKTLYIVDCFGEIESESIEDCVITVESSEIQKL